MIRKLNYTGRKKIRRSGVRVDILADGNNRRFFNMRLGFDGLGLPENASVFVEAYHRYSYQRYAYGTVFRLSVPADRYLNRFPETVIPLFRVKVVGKHPHRGRILAALDRIRPASVGDVEIGGQSLLYVEYEDLGHRIWQLDLDGDWPVLRLNTRAAEIGLIAGTDSRFMALVYPEVLRQILKRIVLENRHTDPDCDDDWPSQWLKLVCAYPEMRPPSTASRAEQVDWIETAVEVFCAQCNALELFNQSVTQVL